MGAIPADPACFNTQPPEGGWSFISGECDIHDPFQHTAA